jgi:excisionase family DNA binding protein
MAATAPLSAPHSADSLITLSEAAAQLRICTQTLRSWIVAGKLPFIKTGRKIFFLESDLDSFLRSSRIAK